MAAQQTKDVFSLCFLSILTGNCFRPQEKPPLKMSLCGQGVVAAVGPESLLPSMGTVETMEDKAGLRTVSGKEVKTACPFPAYCWGHSGPGTSWAKSQETFPGSQLSCPSVPLRLPSHAQGAPRSHSASNSGRRATFLPAFPPQTTHPRKEASKPGEIR